jgi:hypothetical protein
MENNKYYNKNVEDLIRRSTESIRFARRKYLKVKEMVNNTPLQIRMANVLIPFILAYYFTKIRYNLTWSIIFSIITAFAMLLLSKLMAIIFIILYIIFITNAARKNNNTLGVPIYQTDIIQNGSPYSCLDQSLVINNNALAQDLNGGYFTYSFWIYITKSTGTVEPNWNNYRYHEWKSIFYRGNAINQDGDLSSLIQFPGFWLTPVLNNMVIVFQNGSYVERLEMDNIPFNTWTNFTVVVETKSVSVYVNGYLDRTLNLYQNITIMNAYNLYITSDALTNTRKKESGFAGYLAELIFYNYALTSYDVIQSYNYYLSIINNYQSNINQKNQSNYKVPALLTNNMPITQNNNLS